LAAWGILAALVTTGQGPPGQETALQKFKRWLADRLKIDLLLYDRVTRFRGGEGETDRAVTLRVFDLSIDKETDKLDCAGCRSPVMIGRDEVLTLGGDGRTIGYHLPNRVSTPYSSPLHLTMLVTGFPTGNEFVGLVSVDIGNPDTCKLKAVAFAIRGDSVLPARESPDACVESMNDLFLPGALRNERLLQASRGPLRKLTIHSIVQTGRDYLVGPGDPVSKKLDNDGISRFSPVWVDDTRILYLADK
jgi:hypothetical protein